MLANNQKGYAVMTKDLSAYSFDAPSIDKCKQYCRNDDVIAEMIPYVAGISLQFIWRKPYKLFSFNKLFREANVMHFHVSWHKEYLHKIGEIVYENK